MTPQPSPPPFAAAVDRLHAAMAKVANGDISAIKALYSHTGDATSFYGWGGYEKGWDAVSKRWDWAGEQFKGGAVAYRNVSTVVTPELAYTTDIETFRVDMAGIDRPTQWSNRVTHIFRLEDGEWRLVHRHGNRLEDQVRAVDAVGRIVNHAADNGREMSGLVIAAGSSATHHSPRTREWRSRCSQLDRFKSGLMSAVLERTPDGKLIRKAGVMSVVVAGGMVRPGDRISVGLLPGPSRA